jgi:predicted AlkP superfamily pyrophosphatase or phosphodiesterase
MKSKPIFGLLLGAGMTTVSLLLQGCSSAPKTVEQITPKKVFVISIDGLRPEFYKSDAYDTPTLKFLAKMGASAEAAIPIYPSLTYPNHTTLVTGVYADKHGISSNTIFTWDKASTQLWYQDIKDIKAPLLWDLAHQAGKTTAVMSWPVSVNADVNWLIPEIFPVYGLNSKETWKLMQTRMKEDLKLELAAPKKAPFKNIAERDEWIVGSAVKIIHDHSPDLSFMHLMNTDLAQHNHGRESRKIKASVRATDRQIKKILESLDLTKTLLVVVGDHGFRDYTRDLDINFLFKKKGWRTKAGKKAWQVVAHPGGGQATIYVNDKTLEPKIMEVLTQNAPGHYKILDRARLDGLHAFPGALCAVDPAEGFRVADQAQKTFISAPHEKRGQHGYLAEDPKLYTGLIVTGAGAEPGKNLGTVRLLDVAPTIAKALGISMPSAEGQPIPLK